MWRGATKTASRRCAKTGLHVLLIMLLIPAFGAQPVAQPEQDDESALEVAYFALIDDAENDHRAWVGPSRSGMDAAAKRRCVNRYHRIDQHALAAPEGAERSITDLAAYLVEPAQNEEEKARAIYRWITENVDYDVEGLVEGHGGASTDEAFRNREAVCEGYGNLFLDLCEAAGLDCVLIRGYGKGLTYRAGSNFTGTNHAWNAVRIDGLWGLVDATWGAGYSDGKRFYPQFDGYYFLTPPDELVWTHLPEDPDWQLLEMPISKEEFENLVYVKPPFFKNGIGIESHIQAVIVAEGQVNVSLSAPEDVLLIARLEEDGRELPERFAFAQREGDRYRAYAALPEPGNYTFRIYSKRKGDPGRYNGTLEYRIEAASGSEFVFPETYEKFHECGAYLRAPLMGRLVAKTAQTFELEVPGAEKVAIISGDLWTHLAGEGKIFSGDAVPSKGDVRVLAMFPEDEGYHGLLRYEAS